MRFPQKPPDFYPVLQSMMEKDPRVLLDLSPTFHDGRYLHWDELRYREPPPGQTSEEWWALLRWARTQTRTPIEAMNGVYRYPLDFSFVPLPRIQEALHEFDRTNVAHVLIAALGNDDSVVEYRVRQLIEEAINSSVLEGARPTTRELARQIVREGLSPANRDERMIANNWRAMLRIIELKSENRPLIVDDVLELHRILGDGALDVPGAEGQLRTNDHNVVVEDQDGNIWHIPPAAEGLRERLESLLRFAEDGSLGNANAFIHPVIRAIVVHFWLGYEHPFRDGNGRIARALYYWCMLRHGYEMAEFLSISGPIDRSPKAYYMAFAYTETDGGDLTYFILHQLNVMHEALHELTDHLKKRAARMALLSQTVAGFDELNHRQRAILQHAIKHPSQSYTIGGHAQSHRVHYHTSRSDLLDLEKRGYFVSRRVGNANRYYPSESLMQPRESK